MNFFERMGRFRQKSLFRRLNQMLDDAMNGTFEESDYDESELSKLEVKWKRYITASQLSRQKIEEERSSVKELVSDISHQTKTPLSNIILYAELAREQAESEETRRLADNIKGQSEKLEFLIQALVKTSRLETGTIQIDPEPNRLSELAEGAVRQAEKKAEAKGMKIVVDVDESLTACFDKKWTTEALFNILDNAVKYAPAGSKIRIDAESYELYSVVRVMDEGPGIAEEEIPKIFSRFYRSAGSAEIEGVGLGLYLSRQIVENQSG
ncbi:MAG: HAMP domain-containing sensor histidine kinase, partial [Bacillota bacterium]|nr:HAMP domain-containing sensor histidine kinase [Bacillota bacterium]